MVTLGSPSLPNSRLELYRDVYVQTLVLPRIYSWYWASRSWMWKLGPHRDLSRNAGRLSEPLGQ